MHIPSENTWNNATWLGTFGATFPVLCKAGFGLFEIEASQGSPYCWDSFWALLGSHEFHITRYDHFHPLEVSSVDSEHILFMSFNHISYTKNTVTFQTNLLSHKSTWAPLRVYLTWFRGLAPELVSAYISSPEYPNSSFLESFASDIHWISFLFIPKPSAPPCLLQFIPNPF
jgi:hypothetical protein